MNNTIRTTVALGLILIGTNCWAASTKQEVQELRSQVEALQQGQADIQKDLDEIKKLLQQGARAAAPGEPAFVEQEVSIGPSPYKGQANATVTLIEYSDYQCPFCARHYRDVMPTLESEYVDSGKLKYVMRENPITSIHPNAFHASLAALCAGDQGLYWDMHNWLFDNQRELAVDNIKAFAATMDMDAATFNQCLDDRKHEEQVNDDLASGSKLGVRGTPGFVLGLTDPNDPDKAMMVTYIKGAQPLDNFKRAIDELLDSAD